MGSSTQVYFNGRKVMVKLQFILGVVKNCLGSSIAYYQAQQQNFWAFQEAWEQTPILPIFEQNLLKFSCFFEKQPNKIFCSRPGRSDRTFFRYSHRPYAVL